MEAKAIQIQTWEGMSEEEILDQLEAEAMEVVEEEHLVPFKDGELEKAKQDYADTSRDIGLLQDEIDRKTQPLKDEKKKLQSEANIQLKALKEGGHRLAGRLYLIPDYGQKIMMRYAADGRFIDTRPFTAKERQLSIHSERFLNTETDD